MNNKLLDFFPEGYTPREGQKSILESVEKELNTNKKFIVLRAPTGSGKSAICTSISRFFRSKGESSYLLCSRKYLQTQYMDDFSSVYSNFWGKANYTCPLISASCSGCPADNMPTKKSFLGFLRHNCSEKDGNIGSACPYLKARHEAKTASASLLNFEAFIANSLNNKWLSREVMLIDEAHCLSDRICSFFEVPIKGKWLGGLKLNKLAVEPSKILVQYKKRREFLVTSVLPVPKALESAINILMTPGIKWLYDEYKQALIPYKSKPLLDKFVFSYADKVILLSATISPNLCKEIGLNDSNCTYIDVPSEFDNSKHVLRYIPNIGTLSKKSLPSKLDHIAQSLLKIASKHPNSRGIVHSTSYKLTEDLQICIESDKNVSEESSRYIFHSKRDNFEDILDKYKRTPGAILVTPSITEGFDGAGSILEWQVMIKCPFPSLGDPRMASFIESDFGTTLFKERALSTVIQTMGRGIRNSTDECYTYILDRHLFKMFKDFIKTGSIPSYIKEIYRARETLKIPYEVAEVLNEK